MNGGTWVIENGQKVPKILTRDGRILDPPGTKKKPKASAAKAKE